MKKTAANAADFERHAFEKDLVMTVKPPLVLLIALVVGNLSGCASETPVARHSGSVVSHVDSYGSGMGGSQHLSNLGQMSAGFDYGDSSKTDWKGSIKWSFLRREGNSDVYKVEWEHKPKGGSATRKVEGLSFDGVIPAKLVVNEQWVISIEPDLPPVKAKSGTRRN